jgi:hypothetical protein
MRPPVTTQRVGVEVLTVTDCPHRGLTLARLRAALDRVGLADVVLTERVIDDPAEAMAAGMHGSPTILVDGHDPFAESGTEPSVSCRLFRTPNGYDGAPSVEARCRAHRRRACAVRLPPTGSARRERGRGAPTRG